MAVLLQLGELDVSEYLLEGYEVNTTPVYDSSVSFTNMLGKEEKPLIGFNVDINCALGDVPEETAKEILTLCQAQKISVTYASPLESQNDFMKPQISSKLVAEYSSGNLWDISISMSTGTIPLNGL